VSVSHRISGFIGRLDPLRGAAAALGEMRVVPLAGGFGFLPLIERLNDPADLGPFPELERLTRRLAGWAAEQSLGFPLAYIETEYWAGRGSQGSVVWQAGVVVLGPVVTSNEGPDPSPLPLERAINRAARAVGVARGERLDEFDALGLGRHRSNHDWLAAAGVAPDV
jgi:hypothetical protein